MDMSKIEAQAEAAVPQDVRAELGSPASETKGSIVLGLLFLVVALPYWTVRLIAGALWRDIGRVGRFARFCGGAYAEAATKR